MGQNRFKTVFKDLLSEGKPVYFLSPHLDDAVLSCGTLLSELSGKVDVTVVTLFTHAHSHPSTFSARRFLQHCGEKSAQVLFEKRRQEDVYVMKHLGVKYKHLQKIDGTWRMYDNPSTIRRFLGRYLPEFIHLYPTFLNIMIGRLHKADKKNITKVFEELQNIIPKDAVIFAPLAIGTHVDHVFTREVATHFPSVIYWADFPYSLTRKMQTGFIKKYGLKEYQFEGDFKKKEEAIRGYTSQLPSLFPDGFILNKPETYFIS